MNPSYQEVGERLAVLEVQRVQAVMDLVLIECEMAYLRWKRTGKAEELGGWDTAFAKYLDAKDELAGLERREG